MKNYKNVSYYSKSLPELKFPSDSFDIIYVFYALHDVSEELREDIIKEFFRILKPEGKLYIKEPTKKDHGMAVDEIRKLMLRNGFQEKTIKEQKSSFSATYKIKPPLVKGCQNRK